MTHFFSWPSDAWLFDLGLTDIALDIGGAQKTLHFSQTYMSTVRIRWVE